MVPRRIGVALALLALAVLLASCRFQPGSAVARIAQAAKGSDAQAPASEATAGQDGSRPVGEIRTTTTQAPASTDKPATRAVSNVVRDQGPGRVLYTRGGNVYLYDLDSQEEMEITSRGVAIEKAGVHYGAPTFVDRESLVVLRWETDANGRIVKRAIESGVIQSESDVLPEAKRPTGLGYCVPLSKLLYLEQTSRGSQETDDFGAELTLFTMEPGAGPQQTRLTSWYGDTGLNHARVRFSPRGDLASLPRFPTDVSDFYGIHRVNSGDAVDVIPESYLGQAFVTGIDFGGKGAYATVMVLDNAIDMGPGLYRLDLAARKHTQIAMQNNLYGLAVSETLGIAVVANDSGDLSVMELGTGDETPLGSGADPDIWPR